MTQTDPITPDKVNKVREIMAYASMGTTQYHKTRLSPLKWTDGVQAIAEAVGAFWLIDMIASHQISAKVYRESFQVWRLTREGGKWFVRCWNDTPGESNRLAVQSFEYSDFPVELCPFDMWVESGVLLLPAEH